MENKISQSAKAIFELINQVESNDEFSDKVSVMDFMCGTGKSTAISMKIRQAIETNQGLLVVTDSVERLEHYMEPYDDELRSFLQENRSRVTILTGRNYAKEHAHIASRPILLITTQRFFRYTTDEIENKFLQWDEGQRKLAIFDEKPILYDQHTLDPKAMNDFETAYIYGIQDKNHMEDKFLLLSRYWLSEKLGFLHTLLQHEQMFPNRLQYFFYYPATDAVNESIAVSADDVQKATDEEIDQYYEYQTAKNIQHAFFDFVKLYIERFSKLYPTAFPTLQAYQDFQKHGGLFFYRSIQTGKYESGYAILKNNKELLGNLSAKTIILDATARLSLDYHQDYFVFHDCNALVRKTPNLHIKLINFPSSKRSMMEHINDSAYFKSIKTFVVQDSHTDDFCIFTYKDLEEWFKTGDDEEAFHTTGHLGNLKGRNEFTEKNVFAQIGVLRCPPSYYISRWVDQHPDIKEKVLDPALCMSEKVVDFIDEMQVSDDFKMSMFHDMLADIEQNIFRSPIRDANYKQPVLYYLFFDTESMWQLTRLIQTHFTTKYGATVTAITEPFNNGVNKIVRRKPNLNNKTTNTQRILSFLMAMEDGEAFSFEKMKEKTGLTSAQIEIARRNKAICDLLKLYKIEGKRGQYIKRSIH